MERKPEPDDRYVTLHGLRFHYRDWGGSGRPLVLLHGLASTGRIWDLMAPQLAGDFRVVALDQRGHGETDKPDTGYDFPSIVGDLVSFVQALALDHPIVVGHSWGGNVALHYGATHPDEPAGLVLVDGGFLEMRAEPGMTWETARERLTPPDLAGTPREELVEKAADWLAPVWGSEVEPILLANFEIDDQDHIHPRLSLDRHMQVVRALWEQKPSDLYPRVCCPVLIVPARPPALYNQAGEWLAIKERGVARAVQGLRNVQVLWLDSIHDVPLHRPAELADAIRTFMAEHGLSRSSTSVETT
jgi:pimeloyl-ACP methyl ester carboxylesterase